jgi:hypothetical protein
VKAKLLITPIKLVTLDELQLLIYILRGVTVQYVFYKDIKIYAAHLKRLVLLNGVGLCEEWSMWHTLGK